MSRSLLRACLACVVLASPLRAEWDWHAGDIARFEGRNTGGSVPERVQQGIEAGLDWVVLSARSDEGAFVGLADVVQEIELNTPRITPVLGTHWSAGDAGAVLFGIDPRAPLPQNTDAIVATAESHRGVSVFDALPDLDAETGVVTGTAFAGLVDGGWSPACEPGGEWDAALSAGHRVFLVGASSRTAPASGQKTYVWSESGAADHVVAGVRRGAAYVAEKDGLHVDLQVNGLPVGSTVFFGREPYVRIRAYGRYPISRVTLIADGEPIWSASPDTTVWEARFFLPLSHHTYIRAILESDAGDCRTMANPVFLVSEPSDAGGEIPMEANPRHEADPFLDLGGIIEAIVNLGVDAQHKILAEFLSDPAMRHPTVWLLQNRADLVSDDLLLDLLAAGPTEVRLGAAYAISTRATDGIGDIFPSLLTDADPRVRAYAARLIYQFTGGIGDARLLESAPASDPTVRAYMIRAYNPTRNDPDITRALITDLRAPNAAVSSAAHDKLVRLGTRDFRVILALVDSAEAGNPDALEAVGLIGDRRSVGRLQDIYRRERHGALKRAAFLALARMDAPYENRKSLPCPRIAVAPQLDGRLAEGEWESAAPIANFASDWDGAPASRAITGYIARDDRRLYLALTCETPDSALAAVRAPDAPGLADDEHVEIDLSTPGVPSTHVRLALNALGVARDALGGDLSWNADWVTATSRAPGAWTVECALPLDRLSDTAGPLRFNMALVPARDESARLSWSVTYGSPADPERHGDLLFTAAR